MWGDYASNYADTRLTERTIIDAAFEILKRKKQVNVIWHKEYVEHDPVSLRNDFRITYSICVPQAPGAYLETVVEVLLLHDAFTLTVDPVDDEAKLHENLDINTYIILRIAYLLYSAFKNGKVGSNRFLRVFGFTKHPRFSF